MPWCVRKDKVSRQLYVFYNPETSTTSEEDPRLLALDEVWERTNIYPAADGPAVFQCYRNKVTGEEIKSDPRMAPEALRARGVKLEEFELV